MPGDRVIEDASELHGALVRTGASYYQILEVEFGISDTGELAFSRLTYLLPSNEVHSLDREEGYAQRALRVDEINGFTVHTGSAEGPRLWARSVSGIGVSESNDRMSRFRSQARGAESTPATPVGHRNPPMPDRLLA